MKKIMVVTILIFLSACSANKNIKTELYDDLSAKKPQYTDASLEEIEKLKPQITPPIKIAVAQLSGYESWSSAEIHEIESWLPQLKLAGLASDLVVIPKSLLQQECCPKSLDIRTAAAKLQADAVIIVGNSNKTDRYVNPLSFLNLTIVGMWVVPGHHRDSYAAFEAALVDTKNGYIYGIARGEGEEKTIRPLMYANSDTGLQEARMQALKSLGKNITDKANNIIQKSKSGS